MVLKICDVMIIGSYFEVYYFLNKSQSKYPEQ